MAESAGPHGFSRVRDEAVWKHVRLIFLGALLLFLVNILLGFLNALTADALPRWQMLTHLHAGAIGWITLSVIGIAIWIFTGNRTVSDTYARRVGYLAWAGILVFAGYVASFGIGFFLAGDALYLVPVAGTAAMLVIWSATGFVLSQIRRIGVVTTVHLMVTGALIVASVGALLGVLAGLEQAFGNFLPLEPGEIVSVHRGPMELYVLMMGAALVEWIALKEDAPSWTWPGMGQAVLWTIAAIFLPLGIFVGVMPMVMIGFLLGLVGFPLLFAIRMGWRALLVNPTRPGVDAWGFFGTIALIVFPIAFFGLAEMDADWGLPVVFHIFFVGMMTNLLFGVLSAGTTDARTLHTWAEPAAIWGINLGLVAFIAIRIGLDVRHGAILMGLGVLLGVAMMLYRLLGGVGERAGTTGV